jgi:hypothetical protein
MWPTTTGRAPSPRSCRSHQTSTRQTRHQDIRAGANATRHQRQCRWQARAAVSEVGRQARRHRRSAARRRLGSCEAAARVPGGPCNDALDTLAEDIGNDASSLRKDAELLALESRSGGDVRAGGPSGPARRPGLRTPSAGGRPRPHRRVRQASGGRPRKPPPRGAACPSPGDARRSGRRRA